MADIPENPNDEGDLKRSLGPIHLISLGIGCIIGAGIFVLTGQAAATFAGPGVVFSFAIAGLGCLFAGLCYSEFASMIPVAGSAYTYTYATLGKFVAWIIGWNLVLEYLAASSTVAVGWSGYFNDFMSHIGMPRCSMKSLKYPDQPTATVEEAARYSSTKFHPMNQPRNLPSVA